MLTRSALLASLLFALAACAPRTFPSAPPEPKPAPAPAPAPTTPLIREAPNTWQLLDATDGVQATGVLRAERELLAGKQPKRIVVVAVIDNGVDTMHAALRPHLWMNPKEIPGNGRDDDNNGYVDDVRGWNLLGGRDGRIVKEDTYELTRLAAQCAKSPASVPVPYNARCPELQAEFAKKRGEIEQTLNNIRQIEALLAQITPILKRAGGSDSLTVANVTRIVPSNDTVRQARGIFLQMASQGITADEVASAKKSYESQVQYGFNLSYDPRPIVGDDYPDTLVKRYGNADVVGAGADHGTHVSGIIGGMREAGSGKQDAGVGIAQSVRIMAIRTVPEGDERDKDIASAIRYAVDNGAQVINMSFGKGQSPYKALVDAAVKYADRKGVLMVHAAGNEGADAAKSPSFPTPIYLDGGRAVNWIEVGASSWRARDSVVATFSNYGKPIVDLFAPGEDVNSTVPGGGYKQQSGTSMASPVVAGVAALIMSYYPALTASDVKRVILESATRLDRMVVRPGEGGEKVKFSELSTTGGIVNAYEALKMAEQLSAARP